ncbi:MAG: hypothetical protein H6668_02005 [Ardenticatenaceae bacterium]|nr:hypothetical protein [Ardenticatenaceae bacterium]
MGAADGSGYRDPDHVGWRWLQQLVPYRLWLPDVALCCRLTRPCANNELGLVLAMWCVVGTGGGGGEAIAAGEAARRLSLCGTFAAAGRRLLPCNCR